MTKVVHCKKEKYDVYIGRGMCPVTGRTGPWGNPFVIGECLGIKIDRDMCLARYENWLTGSDVGLKLQVKARVQLKGRILGCWCHPQKCHGDILARLVDNTPAIEEFNGNYRFLSNFYPNFISFEGDMYPSVEHAYQAAKTLDKSERKVVRDCVTPGKSKQAGRLVTLQPDWEEIKDSTMYGLLVQKFSDPCLGRMLLKTGAAELVEGNHWGDTYWGVCRGQGRNLLGKLLMAVRQELADEE